MTGREDHRTSSPQSTSTDPDSLAVHVTTDALQMRTIRRPIEVMGTLHGYEEIMVSANVEGRVSRLMAARSSRSNPQSLETLAVPSETAGLVQLTSVANLDEAPGPSQIDRYASQRTVRFLANPDGVSLNEAVQRATGIAASLDMPQEYELDFTSQANTLSETEYYFMDALGLSVLFKYLILVAKFESWVFPIRILAALPVTVPFSLLWLLMFRSDPDLYGTFGVFLPIGIVKKNGILQVDKTNELRRAAEDRKSAILNANHIRLRPMLMTTMMLIAAKILFALGQSPAAGARASMAKVIIGGQALSLFLALLVTPSRTPFSMTSTSCFADSQAGVHRPSVPRARPPKQVKIKRCRSRFKNENTFVPARFFKCRSETKFGGTSAR